MAFVMSSGSKGQLKCFQCRVAHPTKDGKWLFWSSQQVFLCKRCDVTTKGRPERKDN